MNINRMGFNLRQVLGGGEGGDKMDQKGSHDFLKLLNSYEQHICVEMLRIEFLFIT